MQSREEFRQHMAEAHNTTLREQLAALAVTVLLLLPWIIAALLMGFGYPEWLF